MESVPIPTALIRPAVLCRELVSMTMGLGFVWIERQAVKCGPLFNCFEAVVPAGADVGAIKRVVQLSIVGIL